ncbi:MAG: MerR family transcriptional regulator [Bacillota bacterium]
MYSTQEAADRIGVSKATLLRWISSEMIRDVERDQRGWRIWSDEDIARVKRFRDSYRHSGGASYEDLPVDLKLSRLQTLTVNPGRRYQDARLPHPEDRPKRGDKV